MRLATASLVVGFVGLGCFASPALADEVFHRQVTFALDPGTFVTDASGVFVTYNSGFSPAFLPVRPQNRDRLLLHVKFVDADGTPQYLILRNLGKGYLAPGGRQRLQATLGLSAGTVSGGYTGGWVLTESLNGNAGNLVCCTNGVTNSTTMTTAISSTFSRRDGSVAIHEMRIEFNFNTSNAPIFTDGGGLDRLALDIRAEGMTALSFPNLHLVSGPLRADGTRVDLDGDGRLEEATVGIGLHESQHYRYEVGFGNKRGTVGVNEFSLMDVLPTGFSFDPEAESVVRGCVDGVCDGVNTFDFTGFGQSQYCSTTISGPSGKNGTIDPRYVVMNVTGILAGQFCVFEFFVKTVVASKLKGQPVFAPDTCVIAEGALAPTSITRTIRLTEGLMLFDKANQSLLGISTKLASLGEPLPNPIELKPVGCYR